MEQDITVIHCQPWSQMPSLLWSWSIHCMQCCMVLFTPTCSICEWSGLSLLFDPLTQRIQDSTRHVRDCDPIDVTSHHSSDSTENSVLLYYLTRVMICQHLYFTLYSWTPSAPERASVASSSSTPTGSIDANNFDVHHSVFSSDMERWRGKLCSMLQVWAYIAGGSALVIPYVHH